MKRLLILATIAGLCALQAQGPALFSISETDRLNVSQAEAQLWKLRYSVEAQQTRLAQIIGSLRSQCEASGGLFMVPEHTASVAMEMSCKQQEKE